MTEMTESKNGRYHTPVMLDEVIWLMNPKPGGTYVDCTLGSGGHTLGLVERMGTGGTIVGIDRDEDAIAAAKRELKHCSDSLIFVNGSFSELEEIVRSLDIEQVDGILFDLGVSSYQLDEPLRGFSYTENGPLDMRMQQGKGVSARDLVNNLPFEELRDILKDYGEERWASRIAEFIVKRRDTAPILTTGELVEVIKAAIPASARRSGPHPARRTFQALRIAVNRELDELRSGLGQAVRILAPGGRLVVISYHSLEDRIVKTVFRKMSGSRNQGCLRILTKKPIIPSKEEVISNPRSRSAKLRAAEKF